jgi:hypothetical protein
LVSDLLASVSVALSTPESLIERSAAARAAANGTTVDEVLAAWSGGAPAVSAAPVETAAPETAPVEAAPAPTPVVEQDAAAEPAAPATIAVAVAPPVVVPIVGPEEPLEAVSFGRRVRTATRVGAWTGAALGLLGFLVATASWAANATVTGDGPYTTVILADSTDVVIGAALVSILFGAVTAGLSRASAGWANPGMRLSNSKGSTAWLGAFIGLVLGVFAGAMLSSGFGAAVEGVEGTVQLSVLPTLSVMLIGGAVLGALTAAITQAVAVPVAVADGDDEEIESVRGRLGGALSIPMTALIILLLLVLPFAWALIESNALTANGAAVVGIITAAGILGFATLAGSSPNMKISFGEVMVAVVGIGIVLILIFAVLFAQNPTGAHEEPGPEEAAVTLLLS